MGKEEEEGEGKGSCRPAAERIQSRTRSAPFPTSFQLLHHHTSTGAKTQFLFISPSYDIMRADLWLALEWQR